MKSHLPRGAVSPDHNVSVSYVALTSLPQNRTSIGHKRQTGHRRRTTAIDPEWSRPHPNLHLLIRSRDFLPTLGSLPKSDESAT